MDLLFTVYSNSHVLHRLAVGNSLAMTSSQALPNMTATNTAAPTETISLPTMEYPIGD